MLLGSLLSHTFRFQQLGRFGSFSASSFNLQPFTNEIRCGERAQRCGRIETVSESPAISVPRTTE